jgi:tRNA G18 (ribose-2'-O)-methylase SpoU
MLVQNLSHTGHQLEGRTLYERQKALRANQIFAPAPAIIAAGLQLPVNMGSLLRLADAVGSQQVIFAGTKSSPSMLTGLRRTASNCDKLIDWKFCSLDEFIEQAESFQPLLALELTSESHNLFEVELPGQCAFVIGSERYSIPDALLAHCQQAVHIPMYGVNGSMNVTHALAIALFEWRRQHST